MDIRGWKERTVLKAQACKKKIPLTVLEVMLLNMEVNNGFKPTYPLL